MNQSTPELDIRSLLENGFNEETARSLYARGEEIAIFVMMQLAAPALKGDARNSKRLGQSPAGTVPERADDLRATGSERDVDPELLHRVVSSWSCSSVAATRLILPFFHAVSIVRAQCP